MISHIVAEIDGSNGVPSALEKTPNNRKYEGMNRAESCGI